MNTKRSITQVFENHLRLRAESKLGSSSLNQKKAASSTGQIRLLFKVEKLSCKVFTTNTLRTISSRLFRVAKVKKFYFDLLPAS
jgi:hypothetical protein